MFAFIATLTQAGGVVLDKIILTRRQVALHVFTPILFLFLFLLTAVFYPFLGKINSEFFETKNLALFLGLILTALIWNVFYYKAIQSEKVQESELVLMFQPLLTILLASIFLKDESNLRVEVAAFIAAIALICSQIKRHHFNISFGAYDMILAVVFMSAELILIRLALNFLSPVALYALRTGILFLFFYVYYQPKIFRVSKINILLIVTNAILATTQMITKFYGFETLGVVYTSLILILAPLLVYLASIFYFHEKFHLRTAISIVVIFLCIVYATVLGK